MLCAEGKINPAIVINTGMRQDLAKSKFSVIVTASDLFSALRQRSELNTPYLKQVAINKRDGLVVYLGVSYRFGVVKKPKEENLQFDDSLQ